jgi:hypothetical protein
MDEKMFVAPILSRTYRRVHILNYLIAAIGIEIAGWEVVVGITDFLSGGDTLVSDSLKRVVEIVA